MKDYVVNEGYNSITKNADHFQGNITSPTAFEIRTVNNLCHSKFVPSLHKYDSWSIIKAKFESMKIVLATRLI
jgi:hypothetical protein